MKRIGNLYERICSIENLQLADKKASKGKLKQPGVIRHNKNKEVNILRLHEMLINKSFRTSEYSTFKVFEPKERKIYRLPYYPDRILHHAILNVLEPIFNDMFISGTYSCIKKRGIHKAFKDVRRSLKDIDGARYVLKLDIKKYFQSVNHDILKALLGKKFKDNDLLMLLFEIIDSHSEGLPIGNYISSTLGNFYLTYFDHWIKEQKRIKHYFRYCDDMCILHSDKNFLHALRVEIETYLNDNLKLSLKSNYQIFPIASRGLDFVGYKSYHTHSLLRKRIKKSFIRSVKENRVKSIPSYYGWIKHCDGNNLLNKYLFLQ